MKSLFFLIAIAAFFLSIISCKKDFLERLNPGATTDDKFWTAESDVRDYLEVIYKSSIPSGALNPNFQANGRMQMSGVTDECVTRPNFGSWQNFPVGLLSPNDDYLSDLYRQNYIDIRNACRILEHYQKVYMEDVDLKERYAAEARALRAYAHLKLLQFFGPTPIIMKSLSIDSARNIPRSTEDQMADFIIAELELSAQILPAAYNTSDNYRITKGTCYALLMQLHLQKRNYPKVIEYVKKIIGLDLYDLHRAASTSINSYIDLFGYNALQNKEQT